MPAFPLRPALLALLAAAFAGPAAAEGVKPYVRLSAGMDQSGDATLRDQDCAGPKAYFGCENGEGGIPIAARGDFGSSPAFGLGLGAEVTSYFRVELAMDYRPGFQFSGNANFIDAGPVQPVSADVTQADLMAFAYLEPLAAMGVETKLRPFVGFGAGVSRNETDEMLYEFPSLHQPRYSVMPGGTTYDFAWALTAGVAYQVSERLTLEAAYRYSDLGQVETDEGTLFIQKYNRSLSVPIGKTEADLTSQSLTISARIAF